MTKKIVIQVHNMGSDKSRSKAMKIAAVCQGVESVAVEGESKDQLVVTGDGVDSVCLTNQIRKKFPGASMISVEDVKREQPPQNEEPQTEEPSFTTYHHHYDYYRPPPYYPSCYVYDSYPNSSFF
ncbi:heavy metal-associated isoprenylated plant protein 47-like [Arachis stenosperma]|uniref:heavy metal-associated isoprenylated plant protein 47-like n=1 Tax=Arachis stenosperma TaxID=217475 RepID=UPI0025AC3DFD|nr:heavy metal-associated isoprenylated plant protein 47-like [Arachis stenosperma]